MQKSILVKKSNTSDVKIIYLNINTENLGINVKSSLSSKRIFISKLNESKSSNS